jgi:hypothetical protein
MTDWLLLYHKEDDPCREVNFLSFANVKLPSSQVSSAYMFMLDPPVFLHENCCIVIIFVCVLYYYNNITCHCA